MFVSMVRSMRNETNQINVINDSIDKKSESISLKLQTINDSLESSNKSLDSIEASFAFLLLRMTVDLLIDEHLNQNEPNKHYIKQHNKVVKWCSW